MKKIARRTAHGWSLKGKWRTEGNMEDFYTLNKALFIYLHDTKLKLM